MKHWRRTCTHNAAAPLTGAVVSSVAQDLDDTTFAIVTFSQAVTWDGVGAGTMVIAGVPGTWDSQASPTALVFLSGGPNINAGDAWHWSAADTSLTPTPNNSQTGVVT